MKGHLTHLSCILFLTFIFLILSGISVAEVLHSWNEPNPDHAFQNGNIIEHPFSTHTSKSASRSESNGSWTLTASASASANAQAVSPAPGDLRREWDAHALLRTTGDKDTLEPHSGDGLAKTADGAETTLTSSDGTTTARTKRKGHVVSYQNRTFGPPDQRFLDASTSGGKSETSSSSTGLDADPWASSWLEVKRRINLNNDVSGSPFTSTTPDCTSSGNGHTCGGGSTTPSTPQQTVHCRRGEACKDKPGVEGKRDAHKIKCPNQTYKQGKWRWLLLKVKENCKGEKWSCHKTDSDNCTRKHLHLNPPASNGTVINGVFVPSGYSVGACGEHLYASGSASDHRSVSYPCSTHTYYACQTPSTSSHSLQASCTSTDANGNYCTVTSFYACDSHTHSYPSSNNNNNDNSGNSGNDNTAPPPPTPTPPPPPTTVACGGASYTGCSGAPSRKAHHVPSCSHCGNGYWTCGQYAYRHTTQNTCRRSGCGVTYYECQNGTCTSDSGTNPYHWAQ